MWDKHALLLHLLVHRSLLLLLLLLLASPIRHCWKRKRAWAQSGRRGAALAVEDQVMQAVGRYSRALRGLNQLNPNRLKKLKWSDPWQSESGEERAKAGESPPHR